MNPVLVHIGKSIEGNAEWAVIALAANWAWNKRKTLTGALKKIFASRSRPFSASTRSIDGGTPLFKKSKSIPRGPAWDGFVQMPAGSTYADILRWTPSKKAA